MKKITRVLIMTEGGIGTGWGHFVRCSALARALGDMGAHTSFLLNAVGMEEGVSGEICDWQNDRARVDELLNDADAVVIDSYLADPGFYKKISQKSRTAIYIDDNRRIDYPDGLVVNGSVYAGDLAYPRRPGAEYLMGPEYCMIRPEFSAAGKKYIREDVESVMVTFGGSDTKNITCRVQEFLNARYGNLKKNIIVGGSFDRAQTKGIEKLKDKSSELFYNPDGALMKKIMERSDLAVSSCAQTTYELARMGVPSITITLSDNQLNNAAAWKKIGFAENAGRHSDPDLMDKIGLYIDMMLDQRERSARSAIGQKIIDGRGAMRVSREIVKRAHGKIYAS